MDCAEFRKQYLALTDGTLADAHMVEMQRHLAECAACSRHDTAFRRGVFVLRNLPAVEPSPDFYNRLTTRLQQLDRADARAAIYRGPGLGSFIFTAAGVMAIGFLAAGMLDVTAPSPVLSLPPVVATHPAVSPPPVLSSGFAATAAAGVPVWSAAMMAEQAPVHFANTELELTSYGR